MNYIKTLKPFKKQSTKKLVARNAAE